MMKVGCNYLSLASMDVGAFIRTAYELRLDVIDFHTRAFASTQPGYLRGVKMLCLKYGLPIGYLGVSTSFVGAEDELRANVLKAKEGIDMAVLLGAPLARVFAGNIPPQVEDREPLWPPLINCFRQVAEYGAEKGVIVGLQNHDNRSMAATGEDVIRLLRETNHENLSFILDTGQWAGSTGAHPSGEGDPEISIRCIEQTAPYAVYVRTKFYRIDSGMEERLDYPRIVRILKGLGYNGCLSIVYEGGGEPVEAVRKAANYLRALLSAY